jgi:hypothetical protein
MRLLELLLPVWYQGIITKEEVRMTLALRRLTSLHDIQFAPHREKNHSLLPQDM